MPERASNAAVLEMTDVGLLANAIVWSAQSRAAAGQIFNVTNGDVFTWRDLWPTITAAIGVEQGEPEAYSVRDEIAAEAGRWAELVQRHSLPVAADPFEYLGESAALADFALAADRSTVTSTIAIRQAGFGQFIDTAQSVRNWIAKWREQGMLPPR